MKPSCIGRPTTPSYLKLPNFPARFQPRFLIGARRSRSRRLGPKKLFLTLLQLVAGSNGEGYWHALIGAFGSSSAPLRTRRLPTKSALSQRRARVSYRFFEALLGRLLARFQSHALRLRGLRILAIDGFDLEIPRSKSILEAGYRGRAVSGHRDTYYPRLYLTHCYDVLSSVTHSFTQEPHLNEIADAQYLLRHVPKSSLVLYDRLYASRTLIRSHRLRGCHFLMRCRRGWLNAVEKFFDSPRRRLRVQIEGMALTLIKVRHPQTGEDSVFITDLPRAWLYEPIIGALYARRWEVETSFRELIQTARIEQWHSKSINGILQELYAAFWLVNFVKMHIFHRQEKSPPTLESLLSLEYTKPSFKLIFDWIRDHLRDLFEGLRASLDQISELMKFSTQRRQRFKRRYSRELKYAAPIYPYNNTRWVWEVP